MFHQQSLNDDNPLARVEQIKHYVKHRQLLQNMEEETETRRRLCLPKNFNDQYLLDKRNLAAFKEKSKEFKQLELDAHIKHENSILLSKLRLISNGKNSVYGQHKLGRNSTLGGASSFKQQLSQRPSSMSPMMNDDFGSFEKGIRTDREFHDQSAFEVSTMPGARLTQNSTAFKTNLTTYTLDALKSDINSTRAVDFLKPLHSPIDFLNSL